MKRSVQEVLELVVIGLVALVVGMLLLWGAGWVFTFLGWLLRLIGGFIWLLLRFIIPIAIVAGIVYLVVRLVTSQSKKSHTTTVHNPTVSGPSAAVPVTPSATPSTPSVTPVQPAATYEPAPPVTQATPSDERVVETKVDDAEPVDYEVDTSGFEEMDDLAEDLEDSEDDKV